MDAAQAPAGVVVNIEALAGRRGSNAPAAPKVSETRRVPYMYKQLANGKLEPLRTACLWKCLPDLGFVVLHERQGFANVRCSSSLTAVGPLAPLLPNLNFVQSEPSLFEN